MDKGKATESALKAFGLLLAAKAQKWVPRKSAKLKPGQTLRGKDKKAVYVVSQKGELQRQSPKLSKNSQCPCGSGRRYWKCCRDSDRAKGRAD